MTDKRPTIALDFDGVIHSYASGWLGETVIEGPTDGAREAVAAIRAQGYRVDVYSTRAASESGRVAIIEWLQANGIEVDGVSAEKPKALLYVDDRAHRFNGSWTEIVALTTKGKDAMEPWNRR